VRQAQSSAINLATAVQERFYSARAGCFAASALSTDLGSGSPECAAIAPSSFDMAIELDASSDASANVNPATVYDYFNDRPAGVATF